MYISNMCEEYVLSAFIVEISANNVVFSAKVTLDKA